MKKHLIFLLVLLLTFSTFAIVFADEGMENNQYEASNEKHVCYECGKGAMLMFDRVYLGQVSRSSDCYHEDCMIKKYYNKYREFYRCNYCGALEEIETDFATDFEDQSIEVSQDEISTMGCICYECGKETMLMFDRVYLGQVSRISDCYCDGCIIIKYYDQYIEFYKCNNCATMTEVEAEEFVRDTHTLSH